VDYLMLKAVHQTAVVVSFCGFAARGGGALAGAAWTTHRVAKTLPHVVDTVLLASALAMAWMLRLNPAQAPWLMAKIVGLLLYIGLGVIALRPATPRRVRAAAWVGALLVFAWIVSVALTKRPAGFLALI
jgi:uncharacterized membrane protein SirB2